MNVALVRIDPWVNEILVDPLSKQPLIKKEQFLLAPYGRKYPIVGGVFDLRLLNNEITRDQKLWKQGQHYYERWARSSARQMQYTDWLAEIESVKDIYAAIPIKGRCLDVGGHQGRLRVFLKPGQEYISCDPFVSVFDGLDTNSDLVRAYPVLLDPVNFVCCSAEFLPFESSSFSTVHMRSVIDHFLNPELALNEAYRVLTGGGVLIVGLYVHGGRSGQVTIKRRAKDAVKRVLEIVGIDKYKDYHVWHPTFSQLVDLITSCGFTVTKEIWQEATDNAVCYLECSKRCELVRRNA